MKARRVEGVDPAGPLADAAERIVAVRLDELTSLAPAALEPDAATAQHDLRIAAKRLRYVLELTGFCFAESGAAALSAARALQEILGDLHDCDVMLPRVEAAAVAAPHDRGLERLRARLATDRARHFSLFRDRWALEADRGTWERLERAARPSGRVATGIATRR